MIEKVTGIILAGGKSSRMGRNKALLPFKGRTIIERVYSTLSQLAPNTIIVASSENESDYGFLGLPIIPDIHPECGPMGGIHTALSYVGTRFNIVLSCDMPLITPEFLRGLLRFAPDYDIVIPRTSDKLYHPLCAVYSLNCLPVIEECLKKNELKMSALYLSSALRTKVITAGDFPFPDHLLANVNTEADYLWLLELVK